MIFVIVYPIVAVLCMWPARCIVYQWLSDGGTLDMDSDERALCAFLGGLLAILWPLVLGVFLGVVAVFIGVTVSKRIWTGKWLSLNLSEGQREAP